MGTRSRCILAITLLVLAGLLVPVAVVAGALAGPPQEAASGVRPA